MSALEKSLAVLLDVPGVEGAFVLDEVGELLGRDAQFALPEPVLRGASSRIATLLEAAAEGLEAPKELTLVFASHRLTLRVLHPFTLAVLVRDGANGEAVRMASNIAMRQVVRQLTGAGEPSVPALRVAASTTQRARVGPEPPSRRDVTPPQSTARGETPKPPLAPKKPKNDIWG